MQHLSKTVLERIESHSDVMFDRTTKEESAALRDAEKLADMYADINPEIFTISGNYLFFTPRSLRDEDTEGSS